MGGGGCNAVPCFMPEGWPYAPCMSGRMLITWLHQTRLSVAGAAHQRLPAAACRAPAQDADEAKAAALWADSGLLWAKFVGEADDAQALAEKAGLAFLAA